MLNIFSCFCWPSAFPLWKNVYFVLPIFQFFRTLSCMSCLYMLYINPLMVISFSNIFSHSVDCPFILLMVSFAVQKLLSLIRSHLFIFVFVSFTVGDRSKKILLQFMSKSVLPMFSSRSFIVSGLTFSSLIHFAFIFVHGVRECTPKTIRYWRKKLKMAQTDGKIYHVLELEESVLLKWPYYPRQSKSQCNLYQNTNGIFHRTRTNNFKICMETQKTWNSQNDLKKEEHS